MKTKPYMFRVIGEYTTQLCGIFVQTWKGSVLNNQDSSESKAICFFSNVAQIVTLHNWLWKMVVKLRLLDDDFYPYSK